MPTPFSGCIISIRITHHHVRRQTHTTMSSDHLPILIGLQTTVTSSPARHRTYFNLKKTDWIGYRQEIERKLSSRHVVVYPLPWPLLVGGVRCSRLCPPASFSVHLASSAVTPAGSVHKSRGDNVVRMWVQLKR